MTPELEVATPFRLWASQEKELVLFNPGWTHEHIKLGLINVLC